jgi:hypothetical protein
VSSDQRGIDHTLKGNSSKWTHNLTKGELGSRRIQD